MKKILLLLVLAFTFATGYSQVDAKQKTVLGKFILGYDSMESLKLKDVDVNESNSTEFDNGHVVVAVLDEYTYKKFIFLVFIDNTLYSVRYYPLKDSRVEKYFDFLDKNYQIDFMIQQWSNNYVLVIYDPDGEDDKESFVHYDKAMYEKYEKFRDF